MTREEAIDLLDNLIGMVEDNHNSDYDTALQMGIKALEQEPILDKIRAEIEPKCDRINSLASLLPYTAHREIQELLCEIMDLCKSEKKE